MSIAKILSASLIAVITGVVFTFVYVYLHLSFRGVKTAATFDAIKNWTAHSLVYWLLLAVFMAGILWLLRGWFKIEE